MASVNSYTHRRLHKRMRIILILGWICRIVPFVRPNNLAKQSKICIEYVNKFDLDVITLSHKPENLYNKSKNFFKAFLLIKISEDLSNNVYENLRNIFNDNLFSFLKFFKKSLQKTTKRSLNEKAWRSRENYNLHDVSKKHYSIWV